MNNYIQAVKTYLVDHKKDISIAAPIVLFLVLLVGIVVYATVRNMPNIVYQPLDACKLFTPKEAQDLLGDKVIGVDSKGIKIAGNLGTSKCSYTDGNADTTQLLVAAVAVQSGINDEGVAQVTKTFTAKKRGATMQEVKELGKSAFFDPTVGQLNVLNGKQWYILSYGVGQTPEMNTLEKSLELAAVVLPQK